MAHVSSEVALFMHELQRIGAASAQRETASLWRAVHASRCTGPCKTMTARGSSSSSSTTSSNADGRSDGSSSSSGYKGCCCAVDVMLYQRVLLYTARVVQLALLRTQAPASVWPSYCVWFVAAMQAADTPQAAKLLHYAQHTLCAVLLYVPAPRNLYDEFVECRAKQQQQRCECAALVTGGSLGSMCSGVVGGRRRFTSPTTTPAAATTTTTPTVEWSREQLTRLLCVLPPQHVTLPHATGTLHVRLRNPLHIPPFDFVVPGYKCDMCGLRKLYVAYQAITCPYSSSRSNRQQQQQQHRHYDDNNNNNDSIDDDRSYLELTGSGRAGYDICVVCMAHYYRRQLRRLRSCLHAGRRRMHMATPVAASLLRERSDGDCSAAVTANTVAAFATTDVADVRVHDVSSTTEMQWLVLPRDSNRCCCSGGGSGSVMGDSCYTTTTMATTVTADGKCRRRSTRSCLDTSLVTSSSGGGNTSSSHNNNNNNNTLYMCDKYADGDNIMTWCDGGSTRAAVSLTDTQRSGVFDASALSTALRSLSLTLPETATRSLSSLHTLASSSMLTTTTTTLSTLGNTTSTSLTMTSSSNATMTATASRTAYSDATMRVLDDCDNVDVTAGAASSHIAMSGGSSSSNNNNDGSWREGLLPPPPRRPPSRYRSNSLDDTVAVATAATTTAHHGSGSNDSATAVQAEVTTTATTTTIARKQDSDSDSSGDIEQDTQPLPHSNSRRCPSRCRRGSGAHAVHKDRAVRYSLTSSVSTTAATQTQSCNSSNNNSRRSSTAPPCSPLLQQQQQQKHAEQASNSAAVVVVQPPHSRCLVLRRVTTITMRVGVAPRSARVIAWVLPPLPSSPSTRDAGAAHGDGGGGSSSDAVNDTRQDSSISDSNSNSGSRHSDGVVIVRVTHAARCMDDDEDEDDEDKDDAAFDAACVARYGPPADWHARLRVTPLRRNNSSNNSSSDRRSSSIARADTWLGDDGGGSSSSRNDGGAVRRPAQGREEQRQQGDDNTTNTIPVRPASRCRDSDDGDSSREHSNNSSEHNSVNRGGVRVAAHGQPQKQRRGRATTPGATTPRAHDEDNDDGHSRRHSHRHADNDDKDTDNADDDGGRRRRCGGSSGDDELRSDVCAICLGALDEQAPVLTTRCGHVLHVLCMQDYARVRHDTCPLCRCTPALPDMRVPAVLHDNVYAVTLTLTDVEAQCTSMRVCVGALLTHDGRYDNASNIAALRIIRVPVSHS